MVAANPNDRIPSAGCNPIPPVNRLAERVRHYFDQHLGVSREQFLLEAIRREIDFREQRETENGAEPAQREDEGTDRWSTARPTLSAEVIRLQGWLSERLAMVNYERHGLWPKLRRFLFGNRLVRWLGCRASLGRAKHHHEQGTAPT
jgi:hypothetical protein